MVDLLPAFVSQCALPAPATTADRRSFYVPVADGTRLAIDLFTPTGAHGTVRRSTLFVATRYWRGTDGGTLDEVLRRWVAAGYAVVRADVRGTGASFGQWYVPYSRQEQKDIGFLAKWISHQPWSNGKIVMTGNSYEGTTAYLGAASGVPGLAAIAPKFMDYDLYGDLLWVGGVESIDLITKWGQLVRGLDINSGVSTDSSTRLQYVRPIDGAQGKELLALAIKDHKKNRWGFDKAARTVVFRDQKIARLHDMSMDDAAAFNHDDAIERANVPIFGWGSWMDSGVARGMLRRFMNVRNSQLLIIGPWTHGARAEADIFNPGAELDPSTAEQDRLVSCFLRHYVDSSTDTAPIHRIVYFTMGENRWRSSDVWPPVGTRPAKLYFDQGGTLSERAPATAALDTYEVDFGVTTGPSNRWATQAGVPFIDYGDRAAADARLLTYTSDPLGEDMVITGQVLVTLNIISNRTDGNFIVYLEDVLPDGRVAYLTEGMLRGIHRKLAPAAGPFRATYPYRTFAQRDAQPFTKGKMAALEFQMEATSVRLKAGHRLRVAVAGADQGTFADVPENRHGVRIQIARGGEWPSSIEVPQMLVDLK